MNSSEKKYLESLINEAKATLDLFSNKNKTEREKMVARAFLRCLGIEFSEVEIEAGPDEPIDISFRLARFQIREMLGGRKRGVALREQLDHFKIAKTIHDVPTPWKPSAPISFTEVCSGIAEALSAKSLKYGAEGCAALDALVYVNLRDRYLYPVTPKLEAAVAHQLDQQGWRSVSMLFVPYSSVVFAKPNCPKFLKEKVGRILKKWESPDGWFVP